MVRAVVDGRLRRAATWGASSDACKPACDKDECGPIADDCGDVVDCGGCDARVRCGGSGEPSRCSGKSGGKPKFCDDLDASCREPVDGEVASSTAGAVPTRESGKTCTGDGEQCIDGECRVPALQRHLRRRRRDQVRRGAVKFGPC